MHRKKIVHRDIKPENILILNKDELQVCFADLGLACMLNDSRNLIIKCGTPGYVDPDVLKGRRFSEKTHRRARISWKINRKSNGF